MKISAEIVVDGDPDNIEKLFLAEEKAFANQRACYEIKKQKNYFSLTDRKRCPILFLGKKKGAGLLISLDDLIRAI
jgi:hypothetical protein